MFLWLQGKSQALSKEVEVLNAVKKLNEYFADNDPEKFFSLIDDDISLYVSSNPYLVEGKIEDREEFEHSLNSGFTKVWYWHMFQPKVQVFEDAAMVTFHARGSFGPTVEESKEIHFKITDFLVRKGNEWKFIHIHLSNTE